MRGRITPLLLALVLLTTLPVGRALGPDVSARDVGRSVAWYPAVGGIIGLLLALVAALTATAPASVAGALLLIAWIGLTGGLHLDGLADATDGALAGHRNRDRTLAVMAEPTAGPMAVIGLVTILLTKYAGLVALVSAPAGAAVGSWFCVPLFARAAAAALMTSTAYRRRDGIARDQAAWRSAPRIWGAIAISLLLGMLLLGLWTALLLACLSGLTVWLWRGFWQARIGGYTGDVAGALIEIVEAGLLVALAWGSGWA
ncbi:adenosylcobinamide-GDP ribazoletransferase [Salinisphaera sp. Q1T1-3]|uniref:adenosylcobinamide-GDP ribazoletransferase n=1 Tax=Salinisphaera sp. Q1T1-3 TaxID=2321229 RepID=UPI00131473AB|nr:adenosylcobinamide-GDP ribazoletransferase [Salinisphaera sp. Q1T1-3]